MLSKNEILASAERVREPMILGVYFLIYDFDIIYVGSSEDVYTRLKSHRANSKLRFNKWFYIAINNFSELQKIEKKYIKKFAPRCNIKHNPIAEKEMHQAIKILKDIGCDSILNGKDILKRDLVEQIFSEHGVKTLLKSVSGN